MTARENPEPEVSTEPYKGVRDFYPEDQSVQRYLFTKLREVCESFGYEEYSASPLEPTELYLGKTSEEIVSEQTYTFTDRGDRSVTLRPEMTPTVARMVAARAKSLPFPLRLYTIANVFRYERPQRGRLREHFQLNADLFGSTALEADIEVITLAVEILTTLGLKQEYFEIRIMSRELLKVALQDRFSLEDDIYRQLLRLIDARAKKGDEKFQGELRSLLGEKKAEAVHDVWDTPEFGGDIVSSEAFVNLNRTVEALKRRGITNVTIAKGLVRGFDYYTGMIFEVFDTHPDNSRSLFGGGRYDNLMDMFGAPQVPAVGFGMGDVTLRDALEVRGLLPKKEASADVYVALLNEAAADYAYTVANNLRRDGLHVVQSLAPDSVGKHIKRAERAGITRVLLLGEREMQDNVVTLKDLNTGAQETSQLGEILKTA